MYYKYSHCKTTTGNSSKIGADLRLLNFRSSYLSQRFAWGWDILKFYLCEVCKFSFSAWGYLTWVRWLFLGWGWRIFQNLIFSIFSILNLSSYLVIYSLEISYQNCLEMIFGSKILTFLALRAIFSLYVGVCHGEWFPKIKILNKFGWADCFQHEVILLGWGDFSLGEVGELSIFLNLIFSIF